MTFLVGLYNEAEKIGLIVWIYRQSGNLSSFWADGTYAEKLLDSLKTIVIIGFDFT